MVLPRKDPQAREPRKVRATLVASKTGDSFVARAAEGDQEEPEEVLSSVREQGPHETVEGFQGVDRETCGSYGKVPSV